MYRETHWAKELTDTQKPDGSWGWFHTLSKFSDMPVTTEHVLRRLGQLGYTKDDDCIRRGLSYMHACLAGDKQLPDRREKRHDWDAFTKLILAANICLFTDDDPLANAVREKWAQVITAACGGSSFDQAEYLAAYAQVFGKPARGGRLEDAVSFYQVSLLSRELEPEIERIWLEYVLNRPDGIYYVFERSAKETPALFGSLTAARYLGALELLAEYRCAPELMEYAVDWLNMNRRPDGRWDMGAAAKGAGFPLSDNWRDRENRIKDCTWRIENILKKLAP